MEHKKDMRDIYEGKYNGVIHIEKTLEKAKLYIKKANKEDAVFYFSPVFDDEWEKNEAITEKIIITVKPGWEKDDIENQIAHFITYYDAGVTSGKILKK